MLPGIRILFATFVLSASVLIFGLGAAALLRSAHEEFVGIPAWRAAQQPMAPAIDAGRPSLALLRVEPPESKKAEPAKPDTPKTVSIDTPAISNASSVATPAEEIKKSDEVRRPRVRRAKRARNIRQARSATTIRHWSARSPDTIQQQSAQQQSANNSPFAGFDAADTTSSGTGSNRRTAARSPF